MGGGNVLMTFRTLLKDATRFEHDELDAMFAALDLGHADGFARFVGVHLACFEMMLEQADHGSTSQCLLRDMVDGLTLDADLLGSGRLQTDAKLEKTPDPLAVDYVVAGSRLGSKVLFKRWAAATDPAVQRANNYFGLDSDASFWRVTCDRLAGIAPDSDRAQEITQDTKMLFELFATAFQSARAKEGRFV